MTIVELAKEMEEQMETRKRKDGSSFDALKEGYPQWMQDVILEVHDKRFPDDDIYSAVWEVLSIIIEQDDDAGEDEIKDALQEQLEADVYTSDLTKWLGDNANNVEYLTQALEDYEPKDGFQLLSIAQYLFKQEIANNLFYELEKMAEEE